MEKVGSWPSRPFSSFTHIQETPQESNVELPRPRLQMFRGGNRIIPTGQKRKGRYWLTTCLPGMDVTDKLTGREFARRVLCRATGPGRTGFLTHVAKHT